MKGKLKSHPPLAKTVSSIITSADQFAATGGRDGDGVELTTGHMLLALTHVNTPVKRVLIERGLDENEIAAHLSLSEHSEAAGLVKTIVSRARQLARQCDAVEVSALHLIIALTNHRECVANQVLSAAGLNPIQLRTIALALVTRSSTADDEECDSNSNLDDAASVDNTILDTAPENGAPFPHLDPSRNPDPAAEEVVVESVSCDSASPERSTAAGSKSLGHEAAENKTRQLLARAPTSGAASTKRRKLARLRDPRITASRPAVMHEQQSIKDDFVFDKERFPTLAMLGRDLSEVAATTDVEPLVGRTDLIEQIVDTLGKRRANNPCLVGEPGVGKTAIVEGLAYLQTHDPERVPFLQGKRIIELNMGRLLSGTQLRGAFSERMAALRNEVALAKGRIIVFLDEIHTLVGAGAAGDGGLDAVTELSSAMADGTFPCIGATSTAHFKRHIEPIAALQRRLQPLLVPEPSPDETRAILAGVVDAYQEHHSIKYTVDALETAVQLSSRYLTDRFLPDKAISLIDLAGSRARREKKNAVTRQEIAEIVAANTDIPIDRLLLTDTTRFLEMEDFVESRIVGHQAISQKLCQVIRRNYAGFSSQRPIGSFLFLGPTGVGKTQLVKVLADFLFQTPNALCRIDMSEFREPHNVARLIGSPPGYVAHEEGGQLTESIRRRPYQIVLLDEIEKAHRDVLLILLQLLDEGRLTDGRGRTVDFSNTVIIMTSNLGSEHYGERSAIGFGSIRQGSMDGWETIEERVLQTAREAFPIELWNRIEERVVFKPLSRKQIRHIASMLIEESSQRLEKAKGIQFTADKTVIDYLIDNGGYDERLGARPMRTAIQRFLESAVADFMIRENTETGSILEATLKDGDVAIRQTDKAASSNNAAPKVDDRQLELTQVL